MKVIKNYKKLGSSFEEFPYIKIKDDEDVFAELPICLAEYNVEYEQPLVYFGPDAQIPIVMSLNELKQKIKGTKLFSFKVGEKGLLKVVSKSECDFSYRLPEDVDTEKLAIIDGQIGLLEDIEPSEQEVK